MARLLTAQTNYLSTTTAAELVDFRSDYTACFWLYVPDAIPSEQQWFWLSENGGGQYDAVRSTNLGGGGRWNLRSRFDGSTGIDLLSAEGSLVSATWYHVAVVRSGSTITLYVDGVSTLSGTSDLSSASAPSRTAAGLYGSSALAVEGLKHWSRALSEAEVWRESRHTLPVSRASLLAAYPLVEGDPDGTDWSGNGYDLTETGTIASTRLSPGVAFRAPEPIVYLAPASSGPTGTSASTLPMVSAFGIGTRYAAATPQVSRPSSDTATGSWTTTPLWSKVDDTEDVGDGVTITSDSVGNGVTTTVARLALASLSDPGVSTGHVMRVRWSTTSGRAMTCYAELYQGTTFIAQMSAAIATATETETTYTLSGTEADAITDYTALEVRLSATGTTGGPSRAVVVEKFQLELPGAVESIVWGLGSPSLPVVTQSASGTAETTGAKTGTSATSLPLVTQSAAGKQTYKATSAATLLLPTSSASGSLTYLGSSASTLPLVTQAAAAKLTYLATSASTLPLVTQAASATSAHVGTSAASLLLPTQDAEGRFGLLPVGTSAQTLLLPTQAASGSLTYKATSSATLPLVTQSSAGTATHLGSSASNLPLVTQSAAGDLTYFGTSAATLPLVTQAASGSTSAATTTTTLTSYASTYGVGRRHVHFDVRSSTTAVGAMNDRDAQGQWRVVRSGSIIHRENGILDFAWLGLDGDVVYARAVDRAGNAGAWASYTFSVAANTAADVVYYVNGSTGNDTTGDGSSGSPWATPGKAATEMATALGASEVGVIFVSGGVTYSITGPLWSGGTTTRRLVRFVWDGSSTKPTLDWPAGGIGFQTGDVGSFHLEGLILDGGTSTTDAMRGLKASSGTFHAWNIMAVNCDFTNWGTACSISRGSYDAANRSDGTNDFVAMEDCTIGTMTFQFPLYDWTLVEKWLLRRVTWTTLSVAEAAPARIFNTGRGYAEDLEVNPGSNPGRWRHVAEPTLGADGAIQYQSWVRYKHFGDSSNGTQWALEAQATVAGTGYAHDIRHVGGSVAGLWAVRANNAATNAIDLTRFDLINCTGAISIDTESTLGTHIHSMRFRDQAISMGNYAGGNGITINGAAARYSDDCFQIHGVCVYFPQTGAAEGMGWLRASSMTRAEFAAKVLESDYNHVAKVDGSAISGFVRTSDFDSSRSAWTTASGFDGNSTLTQSDSFDWTNNGVTGVDDLDVTLTADTGPLAGAGYPLASQVAVDIDGFLRSISAPDAGPDEFGASTLPDDPPLAPTGTSATSLPLPTQAASGKQTYLGSSAPTLPLPTSTASGDLTHFGTSAATLPLPAQAADGATTPQGSVSGTSSATLPLVTQSAVGGLTYLGTASSTLPLPTSTAAGDLTHFADDSSLQLLLPVLSGTGALTHFGTAAQTLPSPTMQATGSFAGITYTGTCEMTLLVPTCIASGAKSVRIPTTTRRQVQRGKKFWARRPTRRWMG